MTEIPLWHQLVFGLPLTFGLLLILGSAFGVFSSDIDAEIDTELDAEADIESNIETEPGFGSALLEMMGVGRVPLTILMLSYSLLFGGIGQAALYLLGGVLGKAGIYAAAAFASLAAMLGSRKLAFAMSRWLPSAETYARPPAELVGTIATAELPISTDFRLARVQAEDGSLMKIRCICAEGTIDKGGQLLLVDFDSSAGTYLVTPSPFN